MIYGTYKDDMNHNIPMKKQTAIIKQRILGSTRNAGGVNRFMREDLENHVKNPYKPLNQLTIALHGDGAHS